MQDISDRKKTELALKTSSEQMGLLIKNTPLAVAMLDQDMKYIMTSARWIQDYKLEGKQVIGLSHYEIFSEILGMPKWLDIHKRALKGEAFDSQEEPWLRSDGKKEWMRWSIHPWINYEGEIGGIILFTEVITSRKETEHEIQQYVIALKRSNKELDDFAYIASHDLKEPLRGLFNNAKFLEKDYGDKLDAEGIWSSAEYG